MSEYLAESDACGLVQVEDVGLLVLLVLRSIGHCASELGVDTGCNGVLGVEDRFGVAAAGCDLCEPLMAVR